MGADYLLLLLSIFAVGCWIGRWLHRCIRRFPTHFPLKDQLTSLWRQGDCAGCDAWETGLQHVPVLGPLVAGRCRKCDRRIDRRRVIVELLTGSLLALLYWVEIPGVGVAAEDSGLFTQGRPPGPECVSGLWSESAWLHLRYLLHAVMICGLIVATMIDLELYIIPDGCTVPAMIRSRAGVDSSGANVARSCLVSGSPVLSHCYGICCPMVCREWPSNGMPPPLRPRIHIFTVFWQASPD